MSYGYGIPIQTGYDLGTQIPLDSRTVAVTLDELNNISKSILYEGLISYCIETKTYYKYTESGWIKNIIPVSSGDSPSMNGTASSGSLDGIYSKADHVHPTDTTRASVQYVNQLEIQFTQSISNIVEGKIPIKLNKTIQIGSSKFDGLQDVTISSDELLNWESLQKIFATQGIELSNGKIKAKELESDNMVSYRTT